MFSKYDTFTLHKNLLMNIQVTKCESVRVKDRTVYKGFSFLAIPYIHSLIYLSSNVLCSFSGFFCYKTFKPKV